MTKFKKGESGNSAGRPKGVQDRRILFKGIVDEHKEKLLAKAINMALEGNEQMLRLLLDRLLPARPKDDPLPEMDNFDGSLTEQGQKVMDLISSGIISPSEGNNLFNAITSQAKLIETDELVKRIETLEKIRHE